MKRPKNDFNKLADTLEATVAHDEKLKEQGLKRSGYFPPGVTTGMEWAQHHYVFDEATLGKEEATRRWLEQTRINQRAAQAASDKANREKWLATASSEAIASYERNRAGPTEANQLAAMEDAAKKDAAVYTRKIKV